MREQGGLELERCICGNEIFIDLVYLHGKEFVQNGRGVAYVT